MVRGLLVYRRGVAYPRLRFLGLVDGSNPIPKIAKGPNEAEAQHSQDKDKQTKTRKPKLGKKKKNSTSGHPADLDWIDENLTESYEHMSPCSCNPFEGHPSSHLPTTANPIKRHSAR
jgi:hypothetical protein